MGNTESSREELSRTKGSGESMSSLRAFATKTDSPADWSSYELRDSDIEFQLESEDGQKRLNALKESVGTELREKYPELVDGERARLVVLGCEIGGRWSPKVHRILAALTEHKCQEAPELLKRSAASLGTHAGCVCSWWQLRRL